jgi:RNA ligase (TIGR02306 family)
MSTFSCPVVRVAAVENHENADRLSIVRLEGLGYTCISAKMEDGSHRYKVGDWVVYIPSASVLPEWLLREMDFWNAEIGKGTLAGSNGDRIKPLRLRGIFSEGVLRETLAYGEDEFITTDFGSATDVHVAGLDGLEYPINLGDNAAEILGITKYEPPIPVHLAGQVSNMTGHTVKYDFERWESVPDIFGPDELVVATEKLHGTFVAFVYVPGLNHPEMFGKNGEILVHSKGLGAQGLAFKNVTENDGNLYVRTLNHLLENGFEAALQRLSEIFGGKTIAVLGEIFGRGVQDLDYGTTKPEFRAFDLKIDNDFIAPDEFEFDVAGVLGLTLVPVLYRGPFDIDAINKARDGVTTVGGTNMREGIVVRSMIGDTHPVHGRKIAKFISPAYLTRSNKNATEFQ